MLQVREVRRALEAETAALAAERATRAQVAALRKALRAIDRSAAEARDGVEEDLAFHRLLAEAAGNPHFGRLLEFLEQYTQEAMRVTRRNDATRADFVEAVRSEHARHRRRRSPPATPPWRGGAPSSTCAAATAACAPPYRSPPTEEKPAQMKILITGGGGFIGSRLAAALLARGRLAGAAIERIVLADQVAPRAELASDRRVETRVGPLAEQCEALGKEGFDGVFHLASAVSGECEADFDLGLRSNLDTTRALLDALRAATRPRRQGRRGWSSRARWRCSAPIRRCPCPTSSATTRCPRPRPRTARTS